MCDVIRGSLIIAMPTSSCGSIGCNTEVMDIPTLLDIINVWNIKKVPILFEKGYNFENQMIILGLYLSRSRPTLISCMHNFCKESCSLIL